MEKQKSNSCGITGMCLGWFIPLVGLILGIIALGRGEPNKTYGILSIIEAVLFWAIWVAILSAF